MAHKRFTDIEKWRDEWYLELEKDYKLVWLYLLDNCTNAGRWKKSLKHLNFCCDTNIHIGDLASVFNGRVVDKDTYLFIPKFLIFQYPNGLNSQKKALIAVVKELKEYGLIEMVIELFGDVFLSIKYQSTIHQGCVQEKEKETDKDKEKEKEKEQRFEFLWKNYPRKKGKDKAFSHFKAQVKTKEDYLNISTALDNFLKDMSGQEEEFIKHGSTWFNKDWKDWINPLEKTQEQEELDPKFRLGRITQ